MAKERRDRVFFHTKNNGYHIPQEEYTGEIDENGKKLKQTRMIEFRNHTFRTHDPGDIAILEKKMLSNPEIIEIDPEKEQIAIGMIKSGEAKPSGVAKILNIKK
jgi:hypothetical protein